MASIYERPPLYKGKKKWDENDNLSEVYKLQSNNPQNKNQVEIHKDNGGYSIKFTVDKRSPNLIKGQKSVNSPGPTPLQSLKMCSKDSTGLPGSRHSMSTFQSLLTQQGQCRASKITTPVKIFVKLLSSFFSGQ
jgi:hypothetical protein